jgi:hypothetical protein
VAPGEAQEMPNEGAASRRAESMSRDPPVREEIPRIYTRGFEPTFSPRLTKRVTPRPTWSIHLWNRAVDDPAERASIL